MLNQLSKRTLDRTYHDIPEHRIVPAHLVRSTVAKDISIHRVEVGTLRITEQDLREVGKLRNPEALVAHMRHNELVSRSHGAGVDSAISSVHSSKEGLGLVVGVGCDDELTVGSHCRVHLAAVVDDDGTAHAGRGIGGHVDETVVGPEATGLTRCGGLRIGDEPFVDCAAAWRYGILFLNLGRVTAGGVGVETAFVLLACFKIRERLASRRMRTYHNRDPWSACWHSF